MNSNEEKKKKEKKMNFIWIWEKMRALFDQIPRGNAHSSVLLKVILVSRFSFSYSLFFSLVYVFAYAVTKYKKYMHKVEIRLANRAAGISIFRLATLTF